MLIPMKQKDIKILKQELYDIQEGVCPLLGIEVDFNDCVVDHKHKRKSDPIGVDGDGLVRNVLQKFANALEGKIVNNWNRMGLGKYADLPTYLRNLADYLEAGQYIDENGDSYIHPTELPKEPLFMKSIYNKIIKEFKIKYPNKKVPIYPKSKKWTKIFLTLAEEFNIEKNL